MEYESPFLIDRPEKIFHQLYILFRNKCLLTAYFGDNGNGDSFITTILDIDIKNNRLLFYHSPNKDSIEKLLNSPIITFKTRCFGVEVVFDTTGLEKIYHRGVLVFAAPIPASILWMERRAFYRVKLPVSKFSYCQLTLKDQEPIKLKLYDISVASVSMLTDSKEVLDLSKTPNLMPLYTAFEQCKLVLAGTGENPISFEIRSKCIINPENFNRMEKIGCKFIQITPAFENTIHRHMQQIERENRQKKTKPAWRLY